MDWLSSNWGWLVVGGGLLLYWMSRRGYSERHDHHNRQEGAGTHQHEGTVNDSGRATGTTGSASHAGHGGPGGRHRHGC